MNASSANATTYILPDIWLEQIKDRCSYIVDKFIAEWETKDRKEAKSHLARNLYDYLTV